MNNDDKRISCLLCGARVHSVEMHLREHHADVSMTEYQSRFPGAQMLSPFAQEKLAARLAAKNAETMETHMAGASLAVVGGTAGPVHKAFHELFELAPGPAAMNASGKPIPISVLNVVGPDADMIPDIDRNHVFDVELLKNICMAFELNMPFYGWGHAGTGKTTTLLQVAARTGRPAIRIQHTISTEESHIVGQWIVKGGETVFQLGPLPLAMLNGWLYIADEYDFMLPSAIAVYQPVLEGNPLVIKDAPPEYRVIKPHPNFRIAGTGNSNGSGDESGLYQGVAIQNSANYDRWTVCCRVNYMKPEQESQVIMQQAKISKKDADRLVDFAGRVRAAYDSGTISATGSPRALIAAAKLGLRRGSYLIGLNLSYINKLGKVDCEAVTGLAERVFGKTTT